MTKMLNMLNKLNMFEHVFFWSLVKQKRKWNLKKIYFISKGFMRETQ